MRSLADKPSSDLFSNAVAGWINVCRTRPKRILTIVAVLCAISIVYLHQNIKIDTDNENMLSAELPFRQNAIALDQGFPQFQDNLLIILDAPTADQVDDALLSLVDGMNMREDVFAEVFSARADPYLRQNSFLYLDLEELEALSVRLAGAQAFLGTLWQSPNLSGLARMFELIAEGAESDDASLREAQDVIDRMTEVAKAISSGEHQSLDWSSLLLGGFKEGVNHRRLIRVQPKLDYGSLSPAENAVSVINSLAKDLEFENAGIRLRLSGSAILESDELKSVESGMGLAGLVSVIFVLLVFFFGFRSFAVVATLILSLIVGLLWTAAFAIAALGSLNLISVAFAVLFVGLSVDFGIHYILRVGEYPDTPERATNQFMLGGKSVATSLGVCVLTTSIAFFSFLPTSYNGLAELGLIAGVGIFIAFIINMTLLPAMLGRKGISSVISERSRKPVAIKQTRMIVVAGLVSAVAAGWVARDVHFDFDPMNLRNPEMPSMQTLFDLWEDGSIQPYAAEVLTENVADAAELQTKFKGLPEVSSTVSVTSLRPTNQNEKLDIIDGMSLFLGPSFFAPKGTVDLSPEVRDDIFSVVIGNLRSVQAVPALSVSAQGFVAALQSLDRDKIDELNTALFGGLPARLDQLVDALAAEPVSLETLPMHLIRQFVTESGQARVEINPSADLRDPDALMAFARAVQSVSPNATGAPITVVEAGYAVLDSFRSALVFALIGISIVLFAALRNVKDVALVFAPVALAAVWTIAASVLFKVPFNFANVIVLPLLFGLSVDYGIHLVMRAREAASGNDLPQSSTPKAVLLSAMTTVGSFASIMLSGHPGTSSMGILLTISIILSLIANLVFLPALMRITLTDPERVPE